MTILGQILRWMWQFARAMHELSLDLALVKKKTSLSGFLPILLASKREYINDIRVEYKRLYPKLKFSLPIKIRINEVIHDQLKYIYIKILTKKMEKCIAFPEPIFYKCQGSENSVDHSYNKTLHDTLYMSYVNIHHVSQS